MAIDPATLKVVAKVATTALSDEKSRWAILIACLVPFIIILLVLSSPFAIFFAVVDGQENQVSVVSALYEMKEDFAYRIQLEQEDISADVINTVVMGSEDGSRIDNTEDVLIAYAIKYNVIQENSEQMAILKEDQLEKLRQVYLDMNSITTSTETTSEDIEVTIIDAKGKPITKTKTISTITKTVSIDCFTAEEIGTIYGFDEVQNKMITQMRQSGYDLLASSSSAKSFLTEEEIDRIKSYMPVGVTINRDTVVKVAESLVGRVNYFWGGKSLAIGWDSRWGTDMEVTSAGSSTTGTLRTFGLDCSGYVTWVFANVGLPAESIEQTIGQGTTAQWNCSSSIPESTVMPGDLAILAIPFTRKVNHIGIVVGRDEKGNILVAHCNAGANNVEITTAKSAGFMHFRRPAVLMD